MELTIGCTTRPYGKLSFPDACGYIAAAGYTDVAVFSSGGAVPVRSDVTSDEAKAVGRIARDAGLEPSMLIGSTKVDLGVDKATDDYKTLIDRAADMGAKWLLSCGVGNPDLFGAFYEVMRRCAPHAEQAGLAITLKPHGGITLTFEDLAKAYHEVEHPAFGLCFDPGNIIYYTKGELRPEPGLDKLDGLLNTGIIKDCVVEDDKADVMVTPGQGLVDFPKVLAGMVGGGFTGPLYVECVGGTELGEIDANVEATLPFVQEIVAAL